MTSDGGLLPITPLPEATAGAWTADELARAVGRLDALWREVANVENALKAQHEELARLHDLVQTVDGRTQRHEVGQSAAREVRQEIAVLEEQIEHESALRRDLAGRLDRAAQREAETQKELQRVLQLIATRLDEFEGKHATSAERQRAITQEIAELDRDDETVEARLARVESQVAATLEAHRHSATEITRVASALPGLLATLESLETRTRTVQADQRRIDDAVAALRAVRDREAQLVEVMEQQRATRARLEDRVSRAEEALEEIRQAVATAAEERSLLFRQVAGEVEQRRHLDERLEAHRDALVEHVRRQMRVNEESGRRRIEEIERDIRLARDVVVRLSEASDEVQKEQPL
jgi:chromosome segregation ATPase